MGRPEQLLECSTTQQECCVRIKLPHLRYLDQFIRRRSSADLIGMNLFPNAKEVTESWACLRAADKLRIDRSDRSWSVFVVGDGRTPRTAALFAFNSLWSCWSIDPRLKHDGPHPHIERLVLVQKPIERFTIDVAHALIVAPHSHASILTAALNIGAEVKHVISMPCCVRDDLIAPTLRYTDWGVHSPKREVSIWRNLEV